MMSHLDPTEDDTELTHEQAFAELEALRQAGAFDNVESLYGKYAREGLSIDNDELNDYLREIGSEWEADLDELGETHTNADEA